MKTFRNICVIARLHKKFNFETINGYLTLLTIAKSLTDEHSRTKNHV